MNCCKVFERSQPPLPTFKIQTIVKKFNKYQSQLDLSSLKNFKIHEKEILNKILEQIQNNYSIKSIIENEKFNDLKHTNKFFQTKIDEIETALISNIENYSKYPTDYIYCLLANHVYCFTKLKENLETTTNQMKEISGFSIKQEQLNEEDIHCDNIWQQLKDSNWVIYEILKLNGYKSIIYINEKSKQIVLAYQGMKFKLEDYFITKYKKYLNSLTNTIHDNFMALFYHIKKCNELISTNNKLEGYSLSFTGYSLGSLLSDLSVFICHKYFNNKDVKSVTFESIGTKQYLNKLNTENGIDLDNLDIKAYFYRVSNFVNATNEHIGDLYLLKNNEISSNEAIVKLTDQNINYHSFYKNGLNSLCSINLKKILVCLEKQEYLEKITTWPLVTINNTSEIAQFKSEPLVFDCFKPIPDDFLSFTNDLVTANLDHLKMFFKIANTSKNKSETIVSQIKISKTETERIDLFQRRFQPQQFNTDYYLNLIHRMTIEALSGTKLINKHLLNLKSKFLIENDLIISSDKRFEISLIETIFNRINIIEPRLKEIIQFYFDSLLANSCLTRLNNKKELFYKQSKNYLPTESLQFLKRNKSEIIDCFNRNQQYTVISGELKSTIAYYYATDIFLQNPNTFAFGIDCFTLRINVLDQFGHFVDDLSPNKLTRDINLVNFLKEIFKNKFCMVDFLIILDNLKNYQDFMDFTNGFGPNVKFLITSDDDSIVKDLCFSCYHFHSFKENDCVIVLKYILKTNYDFIYQTSDEKHYTTPKDKKEAEFVTILKDENSNAVIITNINNIIQKSEDLIEIVTLLKKGYITDLSDFLQVGANVFEYIKSKFKIIHEYLGYLAFLDLKLLSYNLLKNLFQLFKPKKVDLNFDFCIRFLLDMRILIQDRQNKNWFMGEYRRAFDDLKNIEYETKLSKINLIFKALNNLVPNKLFFNLTPMLDSDFRAFKVQFENIASINWTKIEEYDEYHELDAKAEIINRYITSRRRFKRILFFGVPETKTEFIDKLMIKIKIKKVKFESDCKELIFKLINLRNLLLNFDLFELYQEFRFIAQLNCELAIQDLTEKEDVDQDRITAQTDQLNDLNRIQIDKIDRKEKQYFEFNQKHHENLIKKVDDLIESIESLMRNWNEDSYFQNKNFLKITKARITINQIFDKSFKKLNRNIHSFIHTSDDSLFRDSVELNGFFIFDFNNLISLDSVNDLKSETNLVIFFECDKMSNGLYFILISLKKNDHFVSNYAVTYNATEKTQKVVSILPGIIESMKVCHDFVYIQYLDCYNILRTSGIPEIKEISYHERVNTFLKGASETGLYLLNLNNILTILDWKNSRHEANLSDANLQNIINLIIKENNLYTIDQLEIVSKKNEHNQVARKFYVKASFEQSSYIYIYDLIKCELIKRLEFNFFVNDFKLDSDWNLFVRDEKANQMIIYDANLKKDIKQIMGYEFFKDFFIDQNKILFYEHF